MMGFKRVFEVIVAERMKVDEWSFLLIFRIKFNQDETLRELADLVQGAQTTCIVFLTIPLWVVCVQPQHKLFNLVDCHHQSVRTIIIQTGW